jgi:hypothetical protein
VAPVKLTGFRGVVEALVQIFLRWQRSRFHPTLRQGSLCHAL